MFSEEIPKRFDSPLDLCFEWFVLRVFWCVEFFFQFSGLMGLFFDLRLWIVHCSFGIFCV